MGHRRKDLPVLLAIKGNAVFAAMWIAVMVSASAAYAISAGIDWNEAEAEWVHFLDGYRKALIEFDMKRAGVDALCHSSRFQWPK